MKHSDPPQLDDLLARYPGNLPVFSDLHQRLESRSAIAFAGAGASAPLYPLWTQLIRKLAETAVDRGLADQATREYWINNASDKPLQMASLIHQHLGIHYHPLLSEVFATRTGQDGRSYTPAHAALVRANFKGWVTTNYDSGLAEARWDLRPQVRTSGWTIWNQNHSIDKWADGSVFLDEDGCPILYAHGYVGDPESLVLDHESYARAYRATPYRRLFETLWFREHLVFVGYSFHDVVLSQIADEVLSETARQGSGAPRHIAVLGMDGSWAYTQAIRHEYLNQFHAQVLLYPIVGGQDGSADHTALITILNSLPRSAHAFGGTDPGGGVTVARPPPEARATVRTQFVHDTTEDAKFTGRASVMTRLSDWATDRTVRLITITGIGGLGKTSILAHWLRNIPRVREPNVGAIFFWSFYQNQDIRECLHALVAFALEQLDYKPTDPSAPLKEQARQLLSTHNLILALDGLEVIQEAFGTSSYGTVMDDTLSELIHQHCTIGKSSTIILTSRFPFPEFTEYLGGQWRDYPLPGLEPREGAHLLNELGVRGTQEDRELISVDFSGHPLALRLFGFSIPQELRRDPTRFKNQLLEPAQAASGASLDAKLRRILGFYETRLPDEHLEALRLLALFRIPVDTGVLNALWRILPTGGGEELALAGALSVLHEQHLLTAERDDVGTLRYACHPILRDYFRQGLSQRAQFVQEAGSLLAASPGRNRQLSRYELELVCTAIELLADAGHTQEANDLYKNRLDDGWIFLSLPAFSLGARTAGCFVDSVERRATLRETLGNSRLSFFLNESALFMSLVGMPEAAITLYEVAEEVDRAADAGDDIATGLRNQALTLITVGRLQDARTRLAEADLLAQKGRSFVGVRNGDVLSGYVAFLLGEVDKSAELFRSARGAVRHHRAERSGAYFGGFGGAFVVEFLLRTGYPDLAGALAERSRTACTHQGSHPDAARYDWLLADLARETGDLDEAYRLLKTAKSAFSDGYMLYDLARAFVTEAQVRMIEKEWDDALACCARATQIAGPRGHKLISADALILRARVRMAQKEADASAARDDAEAGLALCRTCGYLWGERDALEALVPAYRSLDQIELARQLENQAISCSRRLVLKEAPGFTAPPTEPAQPPRYPARQPAVSLSSNRTLSPLGRVGSRIAQLLARWLFRGK